jgi:hypothetical protein
MTKPGETRPRSPSGAQPPGRPTPPADAERPRLLYLGNQIHFRVRRGREITLYHENPGTPMCLTLDMLRQLLATLEALTLEARVSTPAPVQP